MTWLVLVLDVSAAIHLEAPGKAVKIPIIKEDRQSKREVEVLRSRSLNKWYASRQVLARQKHLKHPVQS